MLTHSPAAASRQGTRSQSSPSQSRLREPFPPPQNTEPAKNNTLLWDGAESRTQRQWHREGAKTINLHISSCCRVERASALMDSAASFHRLQPFLKQAFLFPASSRHGIPLRTVPFLRYPSTTPIGGALPALLRDGEMAMPKSTGGTGNAIPASKAGSAPASASSSLLPPCVSNKGASVPVSPARTAAAKTLPWSRNPPERSRGSRGHWTQPRRPYFGAGAEPGCRNEQKLREKQGVGAGHNWILKYGQSCYFYRGVFIFGGRWDGFKSLFLQPGGI